MAGGEPRLPKKSDLGVRTLSAMVMLAVSGTALWLGGAVWTVFVVAVALGVLWEWWGLTMKLAQTTLARGTWLACGLVYIGLACASLVYARNLPVFMMNAGVYIVLSLVFPVIATDIGAYFAGRTIGGPKIAPSISPSKTWAGLIGGALASGVTFAWITRAFQTPRDLVDPGIPVGVIGIGALIAIIAQTGDFFESWMKRRAGVKDSGSLIPGHGGLFDRVDGLLAVCFVLGLFMLAMRVLG